MTNSGTGAGAGTGAATGTGRRASTVPGQVSAPAVETVDEGYVEQTGWIGWIVFAGAMMVMLGAFHAFQGLIALLNHSYYRVATSNLTIHVSYTAWGWVHLILGIVVVLAGFGLLSGRMVGRIIAVGVALLSAVVNIGFLSAYPIWSTIMIAIDVLVIWAVTVHGREMRAFGDSSTF